MEFEFDRFVEEWAQAYEPMRHTPGVDGTNKRFFICDSYMAMTEFMGQMSPDASPCVVIESQQEGNISEGKDFPRYAMYFMVRADEMNDGHAAIRAKRDAKQVMLDFINFLRAFKEYDEYGAQLSDIADSLGPYLRQLIAAIEAGDPCLQNINIENLNYESLNQMYDGWYGVQVTLDDICVFNKCMDVELYTR